MEYDNHIMAFKLYGPGPHAAINPCMRLAIILLAVNVLNTTFIPVCGTVVISALDYCKNHLDILGNYVFLVNTKE